MSDYDVNGYSVNEAGELVGKNSLDGCTSRFYDEDACEKGFLIEVAKLPKDIKFIKFYIQY